MASRLIQKPNIYKNKYEKLNIEHGGLIQKHREMKSKCDKLYEEHNKIKKDCNKLYQEYQDLRINYDVLVNKYNSNLAVLSKQRKEFIEQQQKIQNDSDVRMSSISFNPKATIRPIKKIGRKPVPKKVSKGGGKKSKWHRFLQKNRGKGKSMKQLSKEYRKL